MIQDIINNITTAEMEAEEILKIASQKAKDIRLAAEVEVAQLKKAAAQECKNVNRLTQNNAEVAAAKKTEIRLREGAKQAELFIDSCEKKKDKAVDVVVGKLVEKYGNC